MFVKMSNEIVLFVEFIIMLLCTSSIVSGRRFLEEQYYPEGYYDQQQQQQYEKIKTALSKLEHEPKLVKNWPDLNIKMGQVSGVALDKEGRLLVFHRASNVWDQSTFTDRDIYQYIRDPPIPHPTVLVFNKTGELVDMWGQNLFYIPHGITVDDEGNVWLTDVALHQVFKFDAGNWEKPSMVLGKTFIPGNDDQHFCKPSAVAVLHSGDFFVADGYCNHRIMKFAPDGTVILQWGKRYGNSPFVFNVPHALTLVPDRGLVCVADRERGRVACFRSDNGTYVAGFSSWLIGARLFSVAYSGGRLYVVNGPGGQVPVRGYVIDFDSGRLVQTFAPEGGLSNPHDIVVSQDGNEVYVAELNPYRVYKFVSSHPRVPSSPAAGDLTQARKATGAVAGAPPFKPTATVEISSSGVGMGAGASASGGGGGAGSWWGGAVGGAAAAGGAALLAVAALALLRARNRGRKSSARRRWEYGAGAGEFKLRRLLERRGRGRFTRVHSDDSDEEPAPMLPRAPTSPPATA